MLKRALIFSAIACMATPVLAQQEEADGPWSGKATLGYLATSGNSENSNLTSGFELRYTTGRWRHLLSAAAIHASENKVTSSEAYELGWKSELELSEHNFLFGRLHWRKDRFSSYEQQVSETVGYGRRLIDRERQMLNVEVGAGGRQSDLVDGTSQNEFILRGALDYAWLLSDTAKFTQVLSAESGSDNTYLESITAFKATLVGELALVASYTIRHNTDVLPSREKSDKYTALSLEYAF